MWDHALSVPYNERRRGNVFSVRWKQFFRHTLITCCNGLGLKQQGLSCMAADTVWKILVSNKQKRLYCYNITPIIYIPNYQNLELISDSWIIQNGMNYKHNVVVSVLCTCHILSRHSSSHVTGTGLFVTPPTLIELHFYFARTYQKML